MALILVSMAWLTFCSHSYHFHEIQISPSNSTNSSTSERISDLQQKVGDSEIEWNMLTMEDKIASGSSADL
jgi:hypothetical protein